MDYTNCDTITLTLNTPIDFAVSPLSNMTTSEVNVLLIVENFLETTLRLQSLI